MWRILKKVQDLKSWVQLKKCLIVYSKNIIPYMYLYKHQVEYYEKMVYEIFGKRHRTDFTQI